MDEPEGLLVVDVVVPGVVAVVVGVEADVVDVVPVPVVEEETGVEEVLPPEDDEDELAFKQLVSP